LFQAFLSEQGNTEGWMKMDVVDLFLIGALKHKSASQVGWTLVPLKTAKRL
jgi:hypothetical protein